MPLGPWTSETRLRCMAAARIIDESLPVIFPAIIRPYHGEGELCEVCGQTIDRYRVEYQVTDARDGYALAFHLLCYRAWQFECRRLSVQAHSRAHEPGSVARSS